MVKVQHPEYHQDYFCEPFFSSVTIFYGKRLEATYRKSYKVYFLNYSLVVFSTLKLVPNAFFNSSMVTWAYPFWDVLIYFFLFMQIWDVVISFLLLKQKHSNNINFLNSFWLYWKQLHHVVFISGIKAQFWKTFRFSSLISPHIKLVS